jgi:hypothetical protein
LELEDQEKCNNRETIWRLPVQIRRFHLNAPEAKRKAMARSTLTLALFIAFLPPLDVFFIAAILNEIVKQG